MNKLLTKIANNEKLAKGVVFVGMAMAVVSNVIVFTGVFYTGLHKGFEIGQIEIEED
jgi:hypothetical protein